MIDKDLLKRRIDTYNNLISRLDRMTSANYMHIVAGMRCTLKAMIDNNQAMIDVQEKFIQKRFSLDSILVAFEKEKEDAFTIKAHLAAGDLHSNDIQFYCNDVSDLEGFAKRVISIAKEFKNK